MSTRRSWSGQPGSKVQALASLACLMLASGPSACGSLQVGGKPHIVLGAEELRPGAASDSFLVLGERLATTGSDYQVVLYLAFADGKQLPGKGVVAAGRGPIIDATYGSAEPPFLNDATFIAADSSGRAFRAWRLPAAQPGAGPLRVVVFCHMARTEQLQWASYKINQWSAPTPLPFEVNSTDYVDHPEQTAFFAVTAEILRPGVYYLGDVELKGGLTAVMDPSSSYKIKEMKVLAAYSVTTDLASTTVFANSNGIGSLPIIDVSGSWKRYPGSALEGLLKGAR